MPAKAAVIWVRCFNFFFFEAEDGIRDHCVTGVQTCALPILTAQAPGDRFRHLDVESAHSGGVGGVGFDERRSALGIATPQEGRVGPTLRSEARRREQRRRQEPQAATQVPAAPCAAAKSSGVSTSTSSASGRSTYMASCLCAWTTALPHPSPVHASSSPNSARRNNSGGAVTPP